MTPADPLGLRRSFAWGEGQGASLVSLPEIEERGWGRVSRLPLCLRIVLESLARHCDGLRVTQAQVRALAAWQPNGKREGEIPFIVSRVLLPDLAGLPVLNDLAAMRATAARLGHDPAAIGPMVRADVVVDHAVSVDVQGRVDALVRNLRLEYGRNAERLRLLKWAEQAFDLLRVLPPGSGISHQLNLERLADVVSEHGGLCFPDTLVGTDSHTPMVNGMGVLGWGVGGLEATAALLGEPVTLAVPDVVGVQLTGRLQPGATATDLVLVLTERLRRAGVVDQFVEFFGAGARSLSVADRATLSNMSADYGATCAYFAADDKTMAYLLATGRPTMHVQRTEAYLRAQGLFGIALEGECDYSRCIVFDLGAVGATVSGPSKPEQCMDLGRMKDRFETLMEETQVQDADDGSEALRHGDILIAAITSCTNTSNPRLMLGAGLLAAKAVSLGLAVPAHVKTSLAPGSRAVSGYLEAAGLLAPLQALGFHVVAHGCTTCMGNSGPLLPSVEDRVERERLIACAVLSGNRNFEARIHPAIKANFLMSPALVVAFALAGTVRLDPRRQPLGIGHQGRAVFLHELWPSEQEIDALMPCALAKEHYRAAEPMAGEPGALWDAIPASSGALFAWDPASTYLVEPPFFAAATAAPVALEDLHGARLLGIFGDGVTTDHITPNGAIAASSPAGRWLRETAGVRAADLNIYAMRRCNHHVMVRGAFDNTRLRNRLADGEQGGVTRYMPGGERMSLFEAAERYRADGVPLVIVAGREWGTGSSRDWAARAPALLGVKAVIASSFERIHRSNLVGMGILPCELPAGTGPGELQLLGDELLDIEGLAQGVSPGMALALVVRYGDGKVRRLALKLRVDTLLEAGYVRAGGLLPHVLRGQLQAGGISAV